MEILLLCVFFVCFIIWVTCIPSGKAFFIRFKKACQERAREKKKLLEAKRKIVAFGESVVNNSNFKLLMKNFTTLSTFAEVEKWDREAEKELAKIIAQIQRLDHEIAQFRRILSRLKFQRHSPRSMLQSIENNYKIPLKNMANKLQESIDFTPDSFSEKKELLKELKVKKKELQLQKREVASNMKAVRREARIKSANAGRGFLMYHSKIAASERRSIRYQKEAQLRPHENEMVAIERQILKIDKDIFWVESFNS